MNFESGKRRSPSQPSRGGQMDMAKDKAKEEGERALKGEVGEVNLPKALIMSLIKDEDVKKAIRASVSSVEVAAKVLPSKDAVSQALSAPYVAPKNPINLAAALMRSLNSPVPKK
eukprot:11728291-Ditylum_brightwellii.AAC.1